MYDFDMRMYTYWYIMSYSINMYNFMFYVSAENKFKLKNKKPQ
jgi:hypothetical protein